MSSKSEHIRMALRKGFADGSSKMAKRKCYGYATDEAGNLTIEPGEAKVVQWIFEQYQTGQSLGKIADGLEARGVLSPTGRSKWNREAIDKLLSNEKYTGRVLLQKTVRFETMQIDNTGFEEQYLYIGAHDAIISDSLFLAVQQQKALRARGVGKAVVPTELF